MTIECEYSFSSSSFKFESITPGYTSSNLLKHFFSVSIEKGYTSDSFSFSVSPIFQIDHDSDFTFKIGILYNGQIINQEITKTFSTATKKEIIKIDQLKYRQILYSNFSFKLSILESFLTKYSSKYLSNSPSSNVSSNFSSNKNSKNYSTQKDLSVNPSNLKVNSYKQSTSISSSLLKFPLSSISSELKHVDFLFGSSSPTSSFSIFNNIVSKKLQLPQISFNSYSFEFSVHSSEELLLDISPIPFEDFIFSITISFLLSNSSVDSFTNSSIQILKKCSYILLSFPITFENVTKNQS
jgi:hypothetical protein